MKKLSALVAFIAVLGAGAAFADTIQNGYGNTFVVTLTNGASARYHFNEDGSYAVTTPEGSQTGRYEVVDSQICFLNADARQCAPLVSGKNVGDTWTQLDAQGNDITVSLVAGR